MESKNGRAVGVREAAGLLGVSPGHVSLVARGLRPSRRLSGRMAAMGIAVADGRRLRPARRGGPKRARGKGARRWE